MNIQALRDHLCERYPALCPLFSTEFGDGVLWVDSADLHAAALDMRDLGFSRLDMVTAVDRGETFELVYRLESSEILAGMSLRCAVPRSDPKVRSVCDVWPAANWHEREVYDMFGIEFVGHPDMRRMLLPPEWEGYPLRKDYEDDRVTKRPDYI